MEKKKTITIDEFMSLPQEKRIELLENNESLLAEGAECEAGIDIDMNGKTVMDIVNEYGGEPMEQVLDEISKKLGI